MTMIDVTTERCFNCGKDTPVETVFSTNAFGPYDLDGRPPEMLRSTLHRLVLRCPTCGHCARSLSGFDPVCRRVIGSPHYQKLLEDPEFPTKANEFRCRAYLDFLAGDLRGEVESWVHAAWVCDDLSGYEQSAHCRKAAAQVARRILDEGGSFAGTGKDSTGESFVILADLFRRAGEFSAAASAARDGLRDASGAETDRRLVLERDLADLRDRRRYTNVETCPRPENAALIAHAKIMADEGDPRGALTLLESIDGDSIEQNAELAGLRSLFKRAWLHLPATESHPPGARP